ncbi:AAA family ATPase [Aestuariimicrobium sp. p3-SID1156]|uniref:AAA family ATPase n=1 Tax=Aestuariimicrobium sp. p3-SID1156 TaxID=2916038 RepID=UPI00223C0E64|nr:AAA family ATPase [Aestuariimicrobium sp. p3-SID1156]MCT1458189.1 AAA family ATPase [Aestuariimicrobium sp. p3-SID1156]
MESPQVVCVNGLPGSGKSTVARGLAAWRDRAVWLEGDLLQHRFTVSGCVDPGIGDEESLRQLDLRWDNLGALTRNFTAAGFDVVVDSLLIPRLWDRFCAAVVPLSVRYVHLAPDRDERLRRDAERGHATVGDRYDFIAEELERLRGLGPWLDSTHQTPEQTISAAAAALGWS